MVTQIRPTGASLSGLLQPQEISPPKTWAALERQPLMHATPSFGVLLCPMIIKYTESRRNFDTSSDPSGPTAFSSGNTVSEF
jgi:hypothetical protein